MSRIFAAMYFFERQARNSNDALGRMAADQQTQLRSKQSAANVLDKLSQMQGVPSTRQELSQQLDLGIVQRNTAFDGMLRIIR